MHGMLHLDVSFQQAENSFQYQNGFNLYLFYQ